MALKKAAGSARWQNGQQTIARHSKRATRLRLTGSSRWCSLRQRRQSYLALLQNASVYGRFSSSPSCSPASSIPFRHPGNGAAAGSTRAMAFRTLQVRHSFTRPAAGPRLRAHLRSDHAAGAMARTERSTSFADQACPWRRSVFSSFGSAGSALTAVRSLRSDRSMTPLPSQISL